MKVPIWEPDVAELPGASKTPFATPEAFGSEIGVAQEKAGRAIESGLDKLGSALTDQYNEQEAIKGKTVLSDYETAFTQFKAGLDRDTPPDQASTKPDKIKAWQDENWPKYRGGVSGRYQQQADGTVHDYNNKINASAAIQAVQDKDKYVELQIDGAAEKQSNALMANPGQLTAASGVVRSMVDETSRNDFDKRNLKIKYGQQMYDAVMQGYIDRMEKEKFNTALKEEAEDFRKNGGAIISKQLGIQDLPQTTPATGVNTSRVNAINAKPAGRVADAAAQATGVDPNVLKTTLHIESGGDPNATTGRNKGAGQLSDDIYAKYGRPGGNVYNLEDNVFATARELADFNAKFTASHGRPPTPTEQYMMHQQGYAGAGAHFANPDGIAWQNVRRFYSSDEVAKSAIWANMSKEAKAKYGSVDNVTSRDFIGAQDKWVSGGTGVTDFKGPVRPDHMAEASTALKMTPEERDLYRTHLKNLYGSGGVDNPPDVKNPQGSRSTLFVTTADIDGKTYIIPTVKDGKILSTEDAIAAAKKEGLDKLPSYKNADEAKARYDQMHAYMEKDTGDYFAAKEGKTRMVQQPTVPQQQGQGPQGAGQLQTRPIVMRQGNNYTVLPTTVSDGAGGFKAVSNADAVATYQKTGQHLGVFDNSSAADDYASRLHGAEVRASVPRTASMDDASPLLGQTPKEFQQSSDRWSAKMKQVDNETKQIVAQSREQGKADLDQEEAAVKAHGDAGINVGWTPEKLAMVFGAHDAEVFLDKRMANLKYNAVTGGWNPGRDPEEMARELEALNPQHVNPQSAAFAQYVKNYGEAGQYLTKMIEARQKLATMRGDTEMKKIIDASRNGTVTQDMIDGAKPWLTHTELTAAYNLKDNPPVVRNDQATIDVTNAIRTMAPPEFQKFIMGYKSKNNISNDEFKSYLERNENYWSQGVQPPIVDAKKWMEDKMSPGALSGIESMVQRGAMADALNELKVWENDAQNKISLRDRDTVMAKAREIYSRYSMQGMGEIRFGTGMSIYFPPGTKNSEVGVNDYVTAQNKLRDDILKHRISETEATSRSQNLDKWRDILKKETEVQGGSWLKALEDANKPKTQTTPPPAPTVKPSKTSAPVPPPGTPQPATPPPHYGDYYGNQPQDTMDRPPPTNGYDRNIMQPEGVMQDRTRTDIQENI